MSDLAIYSESKLLPPVEEILGGLLAKQYKNIKDVELWSEFTTVRTTPTLVLGNLPDVLPVNYVKTLSQNQILTNPSALTVLSAALDGLLRPVDWPTVPYSVVDNLTRVEEAAIGPAIVVDIETGGSNKSDIPEEQWLISLAIYDGVNCYVFTEESLQEDTLGNARAQLIRIFESRKLIAHNAQFDFRTINTHFGTKIYGHADTMLLHHALNPGAKTHKLKEVATMYLGAPDWEADIKKYRKPSEGYEVIPRPVLYHYNQFDVVWTWRLWEYFSKSAQDERTIKLARHEFSMGQMYQDIEGNGIAVNVPYLEELKAQFEGELVPLMKDIEGLSHEGFNPNSPQQVKKWLTEHGYPLKSTAEGILEELSQEELPPRVREFIEVLLKIRGLTKLIGTYVDGITKRIHYGNLVFPSFLVHGTNTGRTSSANPNIQNIPRDKRLRKIFVPRAEGRVLLDVDYSQAELRVMAALSGDDYLISLFQPNSDDFFDALMPSAFPNADIPSWTPQQAKDNRAKLKATIYGLAYNRKAAAIAKSLNMPVREAQAIINNFFKSAPDFYEWRMWVEQVAVDPEATLISPFGRYYQAEVVTPRNKQNIINSGLAFLPQSTASDLCVSAAMEVNKWLHEYDAMIVATIHDAIMIDCPEEHVIIVAEKVQAAMREAGRKVFGDVVVFATEAEWSRESWGHI